jgi:predicted ATPase
VAELPTGTVTFLFTDVEGSTRLLQELGDGYARALAEHRRSLRDAFTRHGGGEVDTQGDAVFFAFERASEALAAASAGREALEQGPIRVRMGLHTGEPITTDEGYVGMDVHRAARIAAAGHGGQILVSHTTRELVAGDGLRDLGEHRLKDLTEPERIYQLGDGTFPPLRTLRQGNLPRPPEPLLGRKKELADLLRLLRAGSPRMLTITGTGGVGKTRLAIEVASEVEQEYLDGAWFVDLAPLVEPDLVIATVASAVGARGELSQHLRERKLLLVLDNFEHVLEAASGLAGALDRADGVVALVTSRAPLRIGGEREYRLRPLGEAPAIELFRARAESADARFDAGYAELAEVCRRLDRLPLAIELAAARARLLAPETLIERLEERLPLLTSGRRDAPERHRMLEATIDWSYELLRPDEREVFARLAVFAGGCTIEAAEEVSGADLDTLQSLLDNSLLRRVGDRIAMLETIREYAAARLEETGQADDVRARHAGHFLALAERADSEWEGHHSSWIARLGEDYDNLRAALDWAKQRNPENEARLVGALYRFWIIRGLAGEGAKWAGDAIERTSSADAGLRQRVLQTGSALAWNLGELELASARGEEMLRLARARGDSRSIAEAATILGGVATDAGQFDRARACYEESLAIYRTLELPEGVAMTLSNLGGLAVNERRFELAERQLTESIELFREVRSEGGLAHAFLSRGQLALEANRLDEASAPLAESLRHFHRLTHRHGAAAALQGLAAVLAERGPAEVAAELLGAADCLLEETGAALGPLEHAISARAAGAALAELGEERFRQAWIEGQALSLDEAADLALANVE